MSLLKKRIKQRQEADKRIIRNKKVKKINNNLFKQYKNNKDDDNDSDYFQDT